MHVIKLHEELYADALEQPGADVPYKAAASPLATALVTVTLSVTATASRAVLTRCPSLAYWVLHNQMLKLCLWQSATPTGISLGSVVVHEVHSINATNVGSDKAVLQIDIFDHAQAYGASNRVRTLEGVMLICLK